MESSNQVFSHQVEVAKRLAKNFDHFYVITSGKGGENLDRPEFKVIPLSWEKVGKVRKIWRIYFQSFKALILFRPTHVFYHMVDTHCSLVSPIFRLFSVQQILWYAHAKNSKPLTFASFFVDRILTSTKNSFPNNSKRMLSKVRVIGQGIDLNLFTQSWVSTQRRNKAVSVGRLDPSKGLSEILEVLGKEPKITSPFEIHFIGRPSSSSSEEYVIQSLQLAEGLYPHLRVVLSGMVPRSQLGNEISKYDFFIHAFRGSLDKVLLEATLVGIPVITCNAEYQKIFGTWSGSQSSTLSEELFSFLSLPTIAINEKCSGRRSICVNEHSLDKWIEQATSEILEHSRSEY
jgi:glycosyltransferase involved in cell wall biosynthesis